MCSQDRKEFIPLQESIGSRLSKKVGTASDIILDKLLTTCALLILYGIGPENIAEESNSWRLSESLQIFQILERFQIRGYSSM